MVGSKGFGIGLMQFCKFVSVETLGKWGRFWAYLEFVGRSYNVSESLSDSLIGRALD